MEITAEIAYTITELYCYLRRLSWSCWKEFPLPSYDRDQDVYQGDTYDCFDDRHYWFPRLLPESEKKHVITFLDLIYIQIYFAGVINLLFELEIYDAQHIVRTHIIYWYCCSLHLLRYWKTYNNPLQLTHHSRHRPPFWYGSKHKS